MGMGWDGLVSINSVVMQTSGADFGKKGTILERQGQRGTREHNINDVREGPYTVGGGVTVEPSAAELLTLLQWALGTADALTPYTVAVDRSQDAYSYPTCCCNSLRLSGSEGDILSCALDIVGTTEEDGSALSAPTSAIPLTFSDIAVTVGSVTCLPKSLKLGIDNAIQPRFLNKTTHQLNADGTMDSDDRVITLGLVVPWDATHDELYGIAIAGLACTITISTLTLTFGKVVAPAESVPLNKGELWLPLNLSAKRTGTTADLTVTSGS